MLAALLGFSILATSPTFDFYARGPYDPSVPKPEAILGYGPGERETTYHLQEEVVRAIAARSKDSVLYIPYGKSTEGKELRVLAITSPENMKRIVRIRSDMAKLASGQDPAADEIIRRSPAVVWINECIHGDEPASFEDAMWLLYNLAASRQPAMQKMLDNCVVILNPSYNPDGHERFVVWYNSVATGNSDRASMEHREPQIVSGRLNHYRFDMNRDRVAMSQAETRQEVAEFLRWHPQAYADQHGQVQTYFFPPASLSVNVNVDRARYDKWADIFGHATGSAFDKQGFPYYVKDVFDLYYPGYLDSWTTLNGAIGMTHETDAGYELNSLREDGSLATLRGAMARHFTSALAVVKAVSDHREEILRDYSEFRKSAVRSTAIDGKRFVTLHSNDPLEIDQLQDQLQSHGIQVLRGSSPMTEPKEESLWGTAGGDAVFEPGTWITIPLEQPQGHLLKTLFEAESDFEPAFVKEQMRRRVQAAGIQKYPGADPAEFYDVTAWNVVFSRNLDAWLTDGMPPQLTEYAKGTPPNEKDDSLGYIARPSERATLVTADLLAQGVKMEVTAKVLTRNGRQSYPPGCYIVYRDRNDADIDRLVKAAERGRGAERVFEALDTSYPVEGREGAGSESIHAVSKPHIGVVFGDESSPTGFGAVWFAMERTFRIPFTPLTRSALSGDLSSFSCLVFPRGQYPSMSDKLRDWVEAGGCAVVLGPQGWAMGLAKLEEVHGDRGEPPGTVPGSLFRAELDPRSFLCYGYQAHGSDARVEIAVPVEGNQFFKAKPEGGGAVVFSSDPQRKKLLSGWEWPDDTEKALQGVVWVHDQPIGRGHLIVFMSDPTERAMWPGLYKLFLNAVILGPRRSGD